HRAGAGGQLCLRRVPRRAGARRGQSGRLRLNAGQEQRKQERIERMQTKTIVEAGDLDTLQKLLGTLDENLNIVARELNVFLSVEGTNIRIAGEEGDVACAQRVLEGMLRLVRAGEGVDKSRIAYCIELAREGG